MPLTVINILNRALIECNKTPLITLFPANDQARLVAAALLLAQANSLRNHWTWPQLKRIKTFSLVAGQDKYMLPPDYYSALPDTQWDNTFRMRLIGPLTDSAFTTTTRGVSQLPVTGYRLFGPDANPNSAGGQLMVTPTPGSSGKQLSFEYISKNIFFPPNWVPAESGITNGKYRNANGNIYKCTAITTGTTGTTAPSHTSGTNVDAGVTWLCDSELNAYEQPVTDDDICMFDDDLMVSGVKWRLLKLYDLDWEVEYESYKNLLDSAKNRFRGTFTGSFNRTHVIRRYSVPNGGWSL